MHIALIAFVAILVVILVAVGAPTQQRKPLTPVAILAAQPGRHRRLRRPVYRIHGLRKDYPSPAGPVTAIRDVNIDIGPGITALVGPSGGGKTTLLNCIGGLDRPTSGDVWFQGELLQFDNPEAMRLFRALGVAFVFQELNLITHQTVIENVALPLLCRGMKRHDALGIARQMLTRLGIAHLAARRRDQLSRGQQQRVAIARAFASGARVILADEPTGSLDPETAEEVMCEFRRLAQLEGIPVVLVTHNHDLARRYCDRVLLCETSGLCEMPSAEDGEEPAKEDHQGKTKKGRKWATKKGCQKLVEKGRKRRSVAEGRKKQAVTSHTAITIDDRAERQRCDQALFGRSDRLGEMLDTSSAREMP